MSSQNYFDLLGDDENEEPMAVIARAALPPSAERHIAKTSATGAVAPALIPTKPPPPSDVVNEQKSIEAGRGSRGGFRGGRGSRGAYNDRERDVVPRELRDGFSRERGSHNDRSFSTHRENNDGPHGIRGGYDPGSDGAVLTGGGSYGVVYGGDKGSRMDGENWTYDGNRGRGGRGGGRGRDRAVTGDSEERPRRREFDRRSGSGFGYEVKRDGSGRGNWGAEVDQRSQEEVVEANSKEAEKVVVERDDKAMEPESHTESPAPFENNADKKNEEEDTELTLDEYEKILEEKRKALSASKAAERKVQADKAFESMQLVERKNDEDVFIKVGSDKEKKKKEGEALEKEEKARKTQSINEFLKPADGEKYYASIGSRSRGRGRARPGESRSGDGERTAGFGARGNFGAGLSNARRASAPRIEDPGQFPTLGGK